MDVTLISKFFTTEGTGIGSLSRSLVEGLNSIDTLNLKLLSMEDVKFPNIRPFDYIYFILQGSKKINSAEYKNSDVFHALTPLESFHTNKKRTVTSLMDFIALNERNLSVKHKLLAKIYEKGIEHTINSERITVLNPDLAKTLAEKYGVDENIIEVIPPPIADNFYPKNEKHDTFNIGTLSSLGYRKRVHLLIKAFMEADIENSQLLLAGTGPNMEEFKKLASGDDRIKFLGFVPDEKINDFYNSLDLFVFPTSLEGYGMPMVEAMGAGKPVITLDDAEIPSNLAKHTHVTSIEELPEVMSNKSYKCDIKKNIEFYKEHSIDKIALKYYKVYESI